MENNMDTLKTITDKLEKKAYSADGTPWEDIQHAFTCITEEKNKSLYGLVCYHAAFYMINKSRLDEALYYLNESIRCVLGTDQEREVGRCYNLLGLVAYYQNNLLLAMEYYTKAILYAGRYYRVVTHAKTMGNMANAYYRVGLYERAIACYKECILQLRRSGRGSADGENTYRKMLANYGCCLIMVNQSEKAGTMAEELQELMADNAAESTVKLAYFNFLTNLYQNADESDKAAHCVDMAVQSIKDGCGVSTNIDQLMSLIHHLIDMEKIDGLKQVLDSLEPQAVKERNEDFQLQILMFRLRYCGDDMSGEEFIARTETFFRLKNKYEFAENNQLLKITGLHNKLRKMEEEQIELEEKNTKLLYQTEHDELSGLYNKRHFTRYMEEVFEEAMNRALSLGVLFIDIDYFKQMNDRYGHQKGDECIMEIAAVIKESVPDDFAARYGGDEFVVLMLDRSKEYLKERTQLIVDSIKARQIPNEDSPNDGVITVTAGAVHAVPHQPNRMWDFLSVADMTLYQQKNEQKGRVLFFDGQEDGL